MEGSWGVTPKQEACLPIGYGYKSIAPTKAGPLAELCRCQPIKSQTALHEEGRNGEAPLHR